MMPTIGSASAAQRQQPHLGVGRVIGPKNGMGGLEQLGNVSVLAPAKSRLIMRDRSVMVPEPLIVGKFCITKGHGIYR